MDTYAANSKYYNPYTWDPQNQDYQNDVKLSTRDELPDDIDAEEIAERMYANMFATEVTWPPFFFLVFAA